MKKTHDDRCRCPHCRHARFNPGPPTGRDARGHPVRNARRKAGFYGHFSYHPKTRARGERAGGAVGITGYQVSGPISHGIRDFVTGMQSRNKYLEAPGLTVRWLT